MHGAPSNDGEWCCEQYFCSAHRRFAETEECVEFCFACASMIDQRASTAEAKGPTFHCADDWCGASQTLPYAPMTGLDAQAELIGVYGWEIQSGRPSIYRCPKHWTNAVGTCTRTGYVYEDGVRRSGKSLDDAVPRRSIHV